MKPYYEHNGITIYHGDCLQSLPDVADESVDLIITDPPYGVGFKKQGEPYMPGDNVNLLPVVLPDFHRILKRDGGVYIFSSVSYLQQFLLSFQMYFKMHNIIVWDKENGIYPHSEAHYKLQYEPIIYGSKGLHYLQRQKGGDVIREPIVRGNAREHPTQKPVRVVEKILESTLDDKRIIFDPFLGSGTTAVAAQKAGRKFIGFELNERYCEIAAKRLSQEVLFTGAGSGDNSAAPAGSSRP